MFVPAQHKKLMFLKHRLFLWLVPVVLQAQSKGCVPSAGCLLDGMAACVSSNSNALGLAHMVLQHDGTQAWHITRLGTESFVLLSGDGGHQSQDGRGFAKLLGNQMGKKKKMPHHFFLPLETSQVRVFLGAVSKLDPPCRLQISYIHLTSSIC